MPGPQPDPLSTPYLELETIERVVAMEDVLARNAAITRGYHELSEAVAALLGREDANWLTFGQWASAEARRSILGESVPALARPVLRDDVSAAVAAGNAAVFGDVAQPFVRWVRAFAADPAAHRDRARADAILAELCACPPLVASEDLRRAFAAYTDALLLRSASAAGAGPAVSAAAAAPAKRRAERILLANASIGAHEQIVADPYVKAAIPGQSIVAIAATMHMGLRIPEGVLKLDRDVPPPAYLGGAQFPDTLTSIEDPDLLALALRFGQDPDSAKNSDAPNWEDYAERMGFIFTLLRSHQQDPTIFAAPPDAPAA